MKDSVAAQARPTPGWKKFLPIVFSLTITSLCLFASAGRFSWPNAWVLLGIHLCASVASSSLLHRDPALLAERSNTKAGKNWDKPIVLCVVLLGPVATWITAGLELRWQGERAQQPVFLVAAIVVALLAAALIAWAMRVNRFFSAVVRIQTDRGHQVVSSGPYAFVRHPGYTGMALFTLLTPVILNSRWAFVPAGITALLTVVRTALEDRTLQRELPGYADYAARVKSRLVPLVW